MKLLYVILFVCLTNGWHCSANTQKQEHSAEDSLSREKEKSILQKYLEEWRTDSTGCLKLRNSDKANFLVDHINLMNKTQNDAEILLGKPNAHYIQQIFIPTTNEDREFLFIIYYFDIHCENGKPTPENLNRCWLQIIIHPDTKKVVSVDISCS